VFSGKAGVEKLDLKRLMAAFMKMRPRLEATALSRARCPATAEDLVQDTWLKLDKARSVAAIDNPAGFVTQVARNTVSDHLRKERRRSEIDREISGLLWEGVDEMSPERMVIGRENLDAVRAALDELPEKTRRIFLMNRIDGIPHRRIAEQMGMTDEAVYYHVRRALERLARLRDDLAD
jgi:RNA polymerase sigma-70 factor (ECF subfamily)